MNFHLDVIIIFVCEYSSWIWMLKTSKQMEIGGVAKN